MRVAPSTMFASSPLLRLVATPVAIVRYLLAALPPAALAVGLAAPLRRPYVAGVAVVAPAPIAHHVGAHAATAAPAAD
jgi:hypothetical protein